MKALEVKVIPNARHERVERTGSSSFTVHVSAPALKGKANKAMLKALAHHLKVKPNELILAKGEKSNEKTVLWI